MPRLSACGDRVCEARELGLEAEVFADAATVKERVQSARELSVRTVRRLRPHGREQRGKVGGFVVDDVVDTMSRRWGIEQASDGLRDERGGRSTCVASAGSRASPGPPPRCADRRRRTRTVAEARARRDLRSRGGSARRRACSPGTPWSARMGRCRLEETVSRPHHHSWATPPLGSLHHDYREAASIVQAGTWVTTTLLVVTVPL